MRAYIDFNGTLQEAADFQRTEDAVSSKTWMSDADGTSYGFSRLPSKSMLDKRGALKKCPHDYLLSDAAGTLALSLESSASKLKWKLEFSDMNEKSLWLKGHILKILSKESLRESKRCYDVHVSREKTTCQELEKLKLRKLRSL